jgi:hypothetical protein
MDARACPSTTDDYLAALVVSLQLIPPEAAEDCWRPDRMGTGWHHRGGCQEHSVSTTQPDQLQLDGRFSTVCRLQSASGEGHLAGDGLS